MYFQQILLVRFYLTRRYTINMSHCKTHYYISLMYPSKNLENENCGMYKYIESKYVVPLKSLICYVFEKKYLNN